MWPLPISAEPNHTLHGAKFNSIERLSPHQKFRGHTGEDQPIIFNRDGHTLEPPSHHELELSISKKKLNNTIAPMKTSYQKQKPANNL